MSFLEHARHCDFLAADCSLIRVLEKKKRNFKKTTTKDKNKSKKEQFEFSLNGTHKGTEQRTYASNFKKEIVGKNIDRQAASVT